MITVKRLNVLVVLVMLLALAVPAITYASVPEGVAERSSVTEVEFTGVISAMNEGSWVVDGQTVKVGPGTEIKGPLAVGDVVKVHARLDSDGGLVARELEASDDFQDNNIEDNSNTTDEINSNNDDPTSGIDNDADQMNGNDNDDHMNGNDNADDHMIGNDNDDDDDHHMIGNNDNDNDHDDDHMSGNDDDDHDNDHDDDDDDHDSNDDHDNDDDD